MFSVVALNVLTMLAYMVCGFLLVLFRKGVAAHAKTLSAMLLYICGPAMIISAFQSVEFTAERAKQMVLFFAATLIIQALFFIILYAIFHKKYGDSKYRILTVGSTLGNVGYFGLPLVTAFFPEEPIVAIYSSVYVMSMNLLVFTMGIFLITGEKKYISVKSLILNPTTLSILFALPFFFLNISFPDAVSSPLSLLGKMTTPICMIVLGMRLATVKFKALFSRPFAYIVCALKLIVFPLFAYLCVCFLPFLDSTFCSCVLILSAAPSGAIILSLAELHECEQELSANVVLLTTIFSVVTLPIIILLL